MSGVADKKRKLADKVKAKRDKLNKKLKGK